MPKVLRPWLWTFLWLIAFSIAYLGLLNFQPEYFQRELQLMPVVGKSSPLQGSAPAYVGVGDSLLAYSLPHEQEFQTLLGGQVTWAMHWMPIATWRSFDWHINANGNNYHYMTVILQDSLFLNREPYRRDIKFADRIHLAKKRLFKELTTGIPLKANRAEESHLIRPDNCKVKSHKGYSRELFYNDQILTKDSIQFLQDLKAQSRQVVVVAFPRAGKKHEHLQIEWQKKLRAELEVEGIALITLGQSMPDAYYCDGSHPNEKGRSIRTAQMLKLIMGLQASTP